MWWWPIPLLIGDVVVPFIWLGDSYLRYVPGWTLPTHHVPYGTPDSLPRYTWLPTHYHALHRLFIRHTTTHADVTTTIPTPTTCYTTTLPPACLFPIPAPHATLPHRILLLTFRSTTISYLDHVRCYTLVVWTLLYAICYVRFTLVDSRDFARSFALRSHLVDTICYCCYSGDWPRCWYDLMIFGIVGDYSILPPDIVIYLTTMTGIVGPWWLCCSTIYLIVVSAILLLFDCLVLFWCEYWYCIWNCDLFWCCYSHIYSLLIHLFDDYLRYGDNLTPLPLYLHYPCLPQFNLMIDLLVKTVVIRPVPVFITGDCYIHLLLMRCWWGAVVDWSPCSVGDIADRCPPP